MEPLLLIAASGLAREVIASTRAAGQFEVTGILDDSEALQGTTVDGVVVLGPVDDAPRHETRLLVCIGAGQGREKVVDRLGRFGVTPDRYACLIDPSIRLPDNCVIGPGAILLAGVVITTSVVIGSHVVAMPNVVFTHDDVVRDYATFAAGVTLGGGVHVGRAAYLGMNASVRQGLRIGPEATLGMGAALLEDLPASQTWVGVPARPLTEKAGQPRGYEPQAARYAS